jgi:hypothetical protein
MRSALPALMLLYNNVAELRQFRGCKSTRYFRDLVAAAEELDVQIANFFAQGIAIDPQ